MSKTANLRYSSLSISPLPTFQRYRIRPRLTHSTDRLTHSTDNLWLILCTEKLKTSSVPLYPISQTAYNSAHTRGDCSRRYGLGQKQYRPSQTDTMVYNQVFICENNTIGCARQMLISFTCPQHGVPCPLSYGSLQPGLPTAYPTIAIPVNP